MSIKKLLNFSNGFYFLCALALFLVIGIAGFNLQNTIKQLDNQIAYLNNIDNIYAQGLQKGQATRNILLNPNDVKAMQNYKNASISMNKSFNKCFSIANNTQKSQLQNLKALLEKDDTLQLQVQSLAKSGNSKQAYALLVSKETPAWRKARSFVLDLISQERKSFDNIKHKMENAMLLTTLIIGLAMIIMLFVVLIVWRVLFSKIFKPLNHINSLVSTLAKGGGDLTITLPKTSNDEFGLLVDNHGKANPIKC